MNKPYISLQKSESVVVNAAANIYAAYITANQVAEGDEQKWMQRAISEAIWIAMHVDDQVRSDTEM